MKDVSYNERKKTNNLENDFVYGEITFQTLAYMYEYIIHKFGTSRILDGDFMDLGSGSGRALIAARIINRFKSYIGIELMNGLFDLSAKLRDNYNSLQQNEENRIFLFKEDFLNFDFAKYKDSISFVLANCKTFPKELMKEIANRISCFRKGTLLITTSQTMSDFDDCWEIIDRVRRQMSWGTALLFVQVKIR